MISEPLTDDTLERTFGALNVAAARDGGGRSGGFRTIIAYRAGTRSVFLYGFAKNERDNIGAEDMEVLKKLARQFLPMSASEIERALKEGELFEVEHDD